MATDLLREKLPPGCQLGVTQDGRVFFIDDQQQTTSWVHPVSGLPVLTGLQGNPDLPRGWEQDVTNDGLVYYVDHSRRITTFQHPKHGTADVPDTSDSNFIPFPEIALHPESPTSPSSPGNKTEQFKRGTVKQRSVRAPSSKRNPDSEVIKRGWLYRLETNGLLKSWKIRWCVLADFALFIYKGDDEAVTLNSILLPSYRIIPCTEADNIKRNFVFKVEHENTKTLYFATEDSAELVSWMSHLQQAAMMNGNGFHREPVPNMRQHPLKASNKPPGFSQQFSDPPHSLDKNPRNSQSSSYRGYGDPASPLATPTDGGSFAIGYGHPNNPSSKHNSLSNSSPRGSQAHSHSSNRDQIFNPDQSRASGSFHGNTDNGDPRRHSNSHHQQQPQSLRDGFAPDSARNSLAQSDSSRVGPNWYNPAQAERQRLNQGPVQGHVDPRNDNSQRDSYSDFDGPVKQLHRWDEGFPNTETEKLKHMSFVDLMEGGRGRQPDTFNARSKSHENFSRLSDSKPQQHPPQQRGGSSNHSFHQHGPSGPQDRSGLNQYQGNMDRSRPSLSQDLRDGRHQQHQDWGSKGRENPDSKQQAGVGPPYHPQQEFQNNQRASDPKLSGDPMRGSVRDTSSQPKHNPGQDRSSFTSNSSTSGAPPGYRDSFNHSYSTHPNTAGQQQQQQQQPRNQNPLPKPHSQFSPQKSDLHLNLQQQPYSSGSNPHIYVNFPNRAPGHSDQAPLRPPYPTAARQKIVEELAETKTPVTQKDFLTSSQLNTQRMQQPPYFQYPSPRDNQAPNRTDQSNVPSQRPVPRPRNQSNSRLPSTGQSSGLPSTSQLSRLPSTGQLSPGAQESPHSPQDSFSRTNMMDPEAQKLRMAYERVHSLRSAPDKAPQRRKPAAIQTVKEDPNMSDRDVLETNLQKVTKKNPLAGPRLRMSISAGDLIGKTHDELVLFLIQLRRNQAALENTKDWYRTQTEQRRALEMEYRKQVNSYGHVQDRKLLDNHQQFLEAKAQTEEIEGKLEVYKPIINLLDNMVTMGSLYGGDNLMLATQYRKHLLRPDQYQPPKKMLEFSRKHQEERLIQETEAEIKQLSSDEVDLEEKIDRLNELDRLLQEQSFKVSSFKEDKELMEKALTGVLRQQDQSSHDPREIRRLTQQQRTLEKEISRVTQQLAEASKELEQTSAENNKLEHEVALLRTKVYGELTRSKSAPSLASETVKTKMMMEKELAKVEGIMQGLSKEGARLSQAMSTIRRSSSSSQLAAALDKDDVKAKSGSYLQTDLDSGEQVDLATTREGREEDNSKPTIYHQRQNAGTPEDWEIEDADENTKRFFGLMPREKPKGLTVRDVKRQAEQRKEKERQKKDGDDTRDGEDVKLLVSNVDNEASSIIHARIPADGNGPVQWDTGLPLYENLPRYGPVSAVAESHSAPGSRRSSLILMAPKPFTPYQDKSVRPFRSELALNASGDPLFTSNVNGNNKHSLGEGTSDVRPYHSVEMLSKPQQDNDKGESNSYKDRNNNGVSNPYENDYPSNNTFGSKHQLSTGQQFHSVPFVPQQAKQSSGRDAPVSNQGGSQAWKTTEKPEWSDQDPPPSADHITRPANFLGNQPLAYTARPWAKSSAEWDSNLFNVKKSPRGRYLTISSSEPLRLEMTPTLHSAAGDLFMNKSIDDVPDIVKSSQTKVDQIDADMIDREILYVPEKVLIPERYDAEADAEHLTEEDKMRRRERGERIKRVLASQSVLSLSQQDVSKLPPDNIHRRVEEEKRERAHYLTLNQELARQVTLQTKKQAAERRKTWSGAQFAEAKRQYEKSPV
ncbi:unnamed protein product [Lymnaea stagnalis]|uniref:Pleckstrin homology domain-containing family A member 7 n=1 Tax=Lymnaea stagnalis TaxID=6523 RepID=A0AAV2H7N2_LYMST